ncbi:MAG: TetR/AcrR family transcriptional regulator [Microthrixaceae bacterium]|nr:TetR/AcrR family transcriptional regulator [Microthrixaceae bacterium]
MTDDVTTSGAGRPNQREFILDTALQLIANNGAAKMSMRQLAKQCGLNVAAIYHYFESKDALVKAVVDERQYGARMAEIVEVDASLSAEDRLFAVFMVIWDGAIAEEEVWRILLGEGLRGESSVMVVGRDLIETISPALTEWIGRSIPELPNSEAIASLLAGQMFTGFIRHIFEPELDTAVIGKEQGNALVTAVFAGR